MVNKDDLLSEGLTIKEAIQKMTGEIRNELVDALQNGLVQVHFTKLNGDQRLMTCTLAPEFLPQTEAEDHEVAKHKRKLNPEVVSAWDTNKSAWRSFRLDRVISAKVV